MTDIHARPRERSRAIPVSSLHEIHRLVQERAGETIALHVGEPHIRMPPGVAEAFTQAIRDGHTSYTDAPGMPALREAIADRLSANGAPHPDLVFVTPGSCQAIAAVLHSVSIEGGVALLPAVHWPIHLQQVHLAGLTPRFFASSDELAGISGACVLILNSPANPSGRVLSPEIIAEIHGWAVRNRTWVISDEAYEDFIYAGAPAAVAAHDAALPERDRVVFSVHTFSKGSSMTGCRLGYVAAPNQERATLLRRVQEATLISPSTPVQFAGLAALGDHDHLRAHNAYVRATRDKAVELLDAAGLLWTAPAGGWYALLDLSRHVSDTGALTRTLLDTSGVALAPGHGFVPAGHELGKRLVRLTLCAEQGATLEGISRLLDHLSLIRRI